MTENERIAIAWARRFLRGHHCPECGREWITASSTAVLFHRCRSPQRRSSPLRLSQLVQDREEERRAWAERALGASPFTSALEEALGDEALRGEEE